MTKETYFGIYKKTKGWIVWERKLSTSPTKGVTKSSKTSININHVLPKKIKTKIFWKV